MSGMVYRIRRARVCYAWEMEKDLKGEGISFDVPEIEGSRAALEI